MRRSQRLNLSDVRKVFRILGDARDLRNDQEQQEVLIVDAMTELLGASFGVAMQFGEFRPKAPTHMLRVVPGTNQDSRVIKYISEWGKTSDFNDDPMKHETWDKAGPVYTTSRSGVMTYDQLKYYRIFDEMVEPAGLKDVIITFFRYQGSNTTRGYSFQRTLKQEEYGRWQHRMTHMLSKELYRLYLQGDLEPQRLLHTLPERLAQMAQHLRSGQSQRQIAKSQNLSYHTVRSYTKELYDTVGVSSREALVVKLFN
jgi:DNA-binding CsgD family transcriptional regulator